jgi:hypothetical protein
VRIATIALCALAAPLTGLSAVFHVAVDGQDGYPGTAEQPFATLAAARDAARRAGPGPHEIRVRAGDYFLAAPLVLAPEDNGLTIVGDDRAKVRLFGGRRLTGWIPDGEHFWQVPLPDAKERKWDFRALLVNGRLAVRATWPNRTDTLEHLGKWDLPLLPMLAGFWARQPTREELTVMPYKPGDIPPDLDVNNAEVRLYHMWAESLVGVASHDAGKQVLVMSSPAVWPMGACDRRKYVIYNLREGMKEPGQWYLDRTQGRLVYWPLPDEDMATAEVIAPVMNRAIALQGSADRPVTGVTLRNLTVQCTSTDLRSPGFGSSDLDGAIEVTGAKDCVLEGLTVSHVGGLGVAVTRSAGGALRNCEVAQTGACGVKAQANGMRVERNHIHHVGIYYPGAAGLIMGGDGIQLIRNEIHDSPYSGVIGGGGKDCLLEENLVYRAMLVMHDGAAIYGNLRQSVIRGNVVRDIRPNGKGFGASAYYLDEGSYDCIVERNVSVNVPTPTHNHITRGTIIRDNVFVSDEDMTVSFQRSESITFSGNTLYVKGKLRVNSRNAAKTWENNRIFRGEGKEAFVIDGWVPRDPPEAPKTQAVIAKPMPAPKLDAVIQAEEWPVPAVTLDRDSNSFVPGGPPTLAQVGYDAENLYVNLQVNRFRGTAITDGTVWEHDDGAEIQIQGKGPDGKAVLFLIRGFAGGALQCTVSNDAVPALAADLQQRVRFAGKISKTQWGVVTGWKAEWQIPFAALGLTPAPALTIPFNLRVYITETGEWRGWEAALGRLTLE